MNVKEQYWKYSLVTIIVVLGTILFVEFIPFLGGILGACTIYILVRKQMLYLTEKKHLRRSFVAVILLLETILCFLIPLSLAVWLFINKLQNFNLDPTQLVKSAEHIAMGGISGFAINVAVLVLILYFMLIGGAKMEKYVYSILPFSDENKKNVLNEINMIVTSNAIGIPLLAIIQGLIALLGYWIFDVPSPFLFGFLTCFATIIPVVGTALVWLPLALYMTLTGDWVNAAGLTAYALIIITNVDNLIRFILQKKMADTHPLITIFGVIIGLSLFGFMGIIFGPLLISIFILCFNIFKEKYLDNAR